MYSTAATIDHADHSVDPADQHAVETVMALARAIDARDPYTAGHSGRVAWLSRLVGEAIGMPERELRWLEWAGLLHDIGKLGIPEHILNKPERLAPEEYALVKRHSQMGYEMLRPVPSLAPILDAVLYHHENADGSGYPAGLAGEQIPMPARIVHVADVFDALTSSRAYRPAHDLDEAVAIMAKDAGRTTDLALTRVLLRLVGKARPDWRGGSAPQLPQIVEGAYSDFGERTSTVG